MLILSLSGIHNWSAVFNCLLLNFVTSKGIWTSETLKIIANQRVIVVKTKYSFKSIRHRIRLLLNKLILEDIKSD